MSVLIYSDDGRTADATIYHPNGLISSQGKYIDQKKEGKWKFFSEMIDGYLLSEDAYSVNIRNGTSVKYYPDGAVAERLGYINDKKDGEWIQYYGSGKIFLKSNYTGGVMNGKFEVWLENGQPQYIGFYKNNLREGKWFIYNEDGTVKYEVNYTAGITKDRQMDIEASEFMDMLEKNKDKIADPEKTGEKR
jgi:antitoxin component YwqK of YwqJK toxin-antitoxin module